MTEDSKIVEKLVFDLNTEVFKQVGGDLMGNTFTYLSDGESQSIMFCEETLWDSENDGREYAATGRREPLEPFVRSQADWFVGVIGKLKFSK